MREKGQNHFLLYSGLYLRSRPHTAGLPFRVKVYALTAKPCSKAYGINLVRTMFDDKTFLYQQDGAPSHTAKSTQEWLRAKFRSTSPSLNCIFIAQRSILWIFLFGPYLSVLVSNYVA